MFENLVDTSPNLINLGLLTIRLALGICFVVHGLGKLGIVGPGNMQGFVGWLASLKVPIPALMARIAMLSELVGGVFFALGFFTRPTGLVLVSTMVVAGLIGHRGGGYLITNNPPGNEYTINLAVVVFSIIVMGPGQFSLDHFLWIQ